LKAVLTAKEWYNKKISIAGSFNCRKQFELKIGFSHIFHIFRSDKNNGAKALLYIFPETPGLSQGQLIKKNFYLKHFQLHEKFRLNAVLNEIKINELNIRNIT